MKDKGRVYYVCSYGGCGSKMLTNFLKSYGRAFHIHSRKPPEKLTFIRETVHTGELEWFDYEKEIPENLLPNYYVIFLYCKPVFSLMSSYAWGPIHFSNIEIDANSDLNEMSRPDYLKRGVDSIKYIDFFNNYIFNTSERNYNLIAVNYHHLWDNIDKLFFLLDIELSEKSTFPVRSTPSLEKIKACKKYSMYKDLDVIIDSLEPVFIIPKSKKCNLID